MSKKNYVGKILSQYSYIFVFMIILVGYALTIISNGNSFNFKHIATIMSSQQTAIIGTVALGMAFVIITGQIDLSVGSSLVLTMGACITVFNLTDSILLMILTAVTVGALCGLINGLLVGICKMPPFVVTLGTMLIYRSITLTLVRAIDPAITGSGSGLFQMISKGHNQYQAARMQFGGGSLKIGVFAFPWIFFVFLGMAILFIVISKYTKYGKSIYAVGSNEKSARLAGINVTGVKISVFVLTGVCVGVASFLQACKMSNVNPASSCQSYEMYAIASVVLAGVNMAGGRGNLLGVIFGAMSYATINFIINNVGLSVDIQPAFQGLVLIVVILIQTVGPVIKESYRVGKRRRAAARAKRANMTEQQ